MVIAFLANRKWNHTVNWVNGLAARGHAVHLISMHDGVDRLSDAVTLHSLPHKAPLGYFLNAKATGRILSAIKPDILNIHFASGYGTLGMLVDYHPAVLSVWGSDVHEFPGKSVVHNKLIRKNLSAVDRVFSTSKDMAGQVRNGLNYKKEIAVTPFGIDLEEFRPEHPTGTRPQRPKGTNPGERNTGTEGSRRKEQTGEKITLGTVKKLEQRYGIDLLLKVFSKICRQLEAEPDLLKKLEFLIVGGGDDHQKLVTLARELNIQNRVTFTGQVPHTEVREYLNTLDIYFALSRAESFGVAVLEASACELPVIVSDKGGLHEVVNDGKTGFIKGLQNLDEIAETAVRLIKDPECRKALGKAGREFVARNYSWDHCLDIMEENYKSVIQKYKSERI